ncbi:MAG TPA: hypothetical protein VHM65_08935, partial [Candidatus Lustribacter sp.]|nr:hypothetical protein [Candidatus Lustribacter sp.]
MGEDQDLPRRPKHPELSEDEDKPQRGDSPPGSVGHTDPPKETDPDAAWVPDPGRADEWRGIANEIGREHRPRREDVYPYLLIRAMSPGDRGQWPLWPPIVCWESPDILLIDAAWSGDFHPSRLVASPTAGRSYRVFVRIWNLGLLPAIGVHVRAWYVNPGFFGPGNQGNPYYQPSPIGGQMAHLEDRTRPGATRLVELDHAWDIPATLTGHECLIASVSCPADQWSGSMSVNADRHIGQRNLTILEPASSAKDMFATLGALIEKGATLELTHGGPAVLPLLHAVAGGRLRDGERAGKVLAPELADLRAGVGIGVSQHLLTAFRSEGGSVVVDSARLAALAGELGRLTNDAGHDDRDERDQRRARAARVHPFAVAGGTRRLIDRLDPERLATVAWTSPQELASAFV